MELEVNKINHALQGQADESAVVVDRNRWFVVTLALVLVIVVLGFYMTVLSKQAANNLQVVYVKLQADGTWDVDYYDEGREVEFFKKTVDHLLQHYVSLRYREMPLSVQADWGEIQFFMGQQLFNTFVDKNGFDAAAKAVAIEACVDCQPKDTHVRDVVHIDFDEVAIDGIESKIYRTNIYFTEQQLSKEGMVLGSEDLIAALHWRVMSRREIEALARKDPKVLKVNPIGIQIIKEDIISTQN